jgi:hypothetical protein
MKKIHNNACDALADNTGYCTTQQYRANAADERGTQVERKKQKPPVSDKSL